MNNYAFNMSRYTQHDNTVTGERDRKRIIAKTAYLSYTFVYYNSFFFVVLIRRYTQAVIQLPPGIVVSCLHYYR